MVSKLNIIIILLNILIIIILYNKFIYNKQIKETNKFVFHLTNLQPKFLKYKIFNNIDNHLFKRVNLIPLKRMASTNEVADKIFFLSTHKNTLISGQVINISGGE